MRPTLRSSVLLLAVTIAAAACSKKHEPPLPIRVLTTPDIAATGAVQHLTDVFEAQTGNRSVTRSLAPALIADEVRRGNADVLFVNDAGIVKSLRSAGAVRIATAIANDDFLLVGPANDPAHVRGADSALAAFRRIHAGRGAFCAAVDIAPLHDRETAIWNAAGVNPQKNRHYRECHGDAAAVFHEALRYRAYALTDRASIDALRPRHLVSLLKGVPMLDNDLTVVLVDNHKPQKNADWFMEWVMSFRGRDAIDSFRIGNVKPFYVER